MRINCWTIRPKSPIPSSNWARQRTSPKRIIKWSKWWKRRVATRRQLLFGIESKRNSRGPTLRTKASLFPFHNRSAQNICIYSLLNKLLIRLIMLWPNHALFTIWHWCTRVGRVGFDRVSKQQATDDILMVLKNIQWSHVCRDDTVRSSNIDQSRLTLCLTRVHRGLIICPNKYSFLSSDLSSFYCSKNR